MTTRGLEYAREHKLQRIETAKSWREANLERFRKYQAGYKRFKAEIARLKMIEVVFD